MEEDNQNFKNQKILAIGYFFLSFSLSNVSAECVFTIHDLWSNDLAKRDIVIGTRPKHNYLLSYVQRSLMSYRFH